MTGIGIPIAAAAIANYRKAKNEYDRVAEELDGIKAAIASMTLEKEAKESIIAASKVETLDVEYMPGVTMTTMLRVGNLVGKLFRLQGSIILSNAGQNTYFIRRATADFSILDQQVPVFGIGMDDAVNNWLLKLVSYKEYEKPQIASPCALLKPGQVLEIKLPGGISAMQDGNEQLRQEICAAAGKRLISSVWQKINLNDIETASYIVEWLTEDGYKEIEAEMAQKKLSIYSLESIRKSNRNPIQYNSAVRSNQPGVLRYCLEAFYPKD